MASKRRLSDVLGIAIEGIDLSRPLSNAAFREVEQAFWDGQVLAIKGQKLEPAAFVTFAQRFGKPEPHVIDQFHYPGFPDILILSNRQKDGQPIGLRGSYFHTDYSYLEVRASPCSTRSRCRAAAGILCSPTCMPPTTICRRR